MSKDPAFLFYANDFISGTYLFTNEEVGKYIRLMCLQHQKGRLPKDSVFKVVSEKDTCILEKFTVDENGLYYNQRLEQEINRRLKFCKHQKDNANKRWHKNGICGGTSNAMPLETETETETETEIKNVIKEKKERVKSDNGYIYNEETGDWDSIPDKDYLYWKRMFPEIDLQEQFKKMAVWIHGNPDKAPKRNYKRFITNWLNRSYKKTEVLENGISKGQTKNNIKQLFDKGRD